MRQLLSLIFWEISDKEVSKLKNNLPADFHVVKRLPEYVLTKDNKIQTTEYYLQFMQGDTDETFIVFDIAHSSPILNEEFAYSGFIDTLEYHKVSFFNYKSLINNITVNKYKDIGIPKETIFVMDLEYYSDGEESNLKIIGYLNDKMELVDTHELLEMNNKLNN